MDSSRKNPKCWEIRGCSRLLYLNCPAYQSDIPCWEQSDTQCCKVMGTPRTCDICEVFLKWHSRVDSSENVPEED